MKTLYFDCSCGAAGDMIVGALIDAGVEFDTVSQGIDALGLSGFHINTRKVDKHGITATQFNVELESEHHQPHRHLKDILTIIDSSGLGDDIKSGSANTFRRLAQCEAVVHGTTPDRIHFHEVGAVDSIVDIVGAHIALDAIAPDRIIVSPLRVGHGTVQCAHGKMPVPAPATAELLKGVPCCAGDLEGELVTPTGAALLTQWADEYGRMPLMNISGTGYGSGSRDLADRANVLRVFVGRAETPVTPTEEIRVIEANVDDMLPELLAPLVGRFIELGARDAFLTPITGKKGRPGHLITVLCDSSRVSSIQRAFFTESTTLGVRVRREDRVCLAREWKCVRTKWGEVQIKVGRLGDEPTHLSPEYESCREVAQKAGVPVLSVYEQALALAVRGEFTNA